MKKTLFFLLISVVCAQISFGKTADPAKTGAGLDPKVATELTTILKKPVASGSTDRYKNLVKYIEESVTPEQAAVVADEIRNKTKPFGKYFYERLSTSTVDSRILPLLDKISGVTSPSTTSSRPTKSSPSISDHKFLHQLNERDIVVEKIDVFHYRIRINYSKLGMRTDEYFDESIDYSEKEVAEVIFNKNAPPYDTDDLEFKKTGHRNYSLTLGIFAGAHVAKIQLQPSIYNKIIK